MWEECVPNYGDCAATVMAQFPVKRTLTGTHTVAHMEVLRDARNRPNSFIQVLQRQAPSIHQHDILREGKHIARGFSAKTWHTWDRVYTSAEM